MSWSSGTLTYGYTAKINIIDCVEKIIANLPGENNEWYLDGEDIVIRQNVHTGYKAWNCKATMEEPAEHEVELETDIYEDDINYAVSEAFASAKCFPIKLNVDNECDWDFAEDDGPDPDMRYELRRDSLF